jgi:hypothetical protein
VSRAADGDGTVVHRAQDFDRVIDALHHRGSDEDAPEGVVKTLELDVALEALGLAPIGVAPHRDRQQVEGLLVGQAVADLVGKQDHPGTGGHRWQTRPQLPPQRLLQVELSQQFVHGGALAAGEHDSVKAGKLVGAA